MICKNCITASTWTAASLTQSPGFLVVVNIGKNSPNRSCDLTAFWPAKGYPRAESQKPCCKSYPLRSRYISPMQHRQSSSVGFYWSFNKLPVWLKFTNQRRPKKGVEYTVANAPVYPTQPLQWRNSKLNCQAICYTDEYADFPRVSYPEMYPEMLVSRGEERICPLIALELASVGSAVS